MIKQINTMIGQSDSRSMADIAARTNKDNQTMKTIAILGMLYLPTTLMSSIFSTVFFNIESRSSGLAVYKQIWSFALLAICLTIATFGLWALLSEQKFLGMHKRMLERLKPSVNASREAEEE